MYQVFKMKASEIAKIPELTEGEIASYALRHSVVKQPRKKYQILNPNAVDSHHEYLLESINPELSGKIIAKEWFPQQDCDIFISHSHADQEIAKELAIKLDARYNLNVFIDSEVWKYKKELVQELQDKYGQDADRSADNANYLLASALTHMIDNTECFIFMESEQSVITKSHLGINVINKKTTYSPWIAHEIDMVNLLPIREPRRLSVRDFNCYNLNETMSQMHHEIDTSNFKILTSYGIQKMTGLKKQALDSLYEQYIA